MHSGYSIIYFCQYVCSLGIEPTTFCIANAMLSHRNTQQFKVKNALITDIFITNTHRFTSQDVN